MVEEQCLLDRPRLDLAIFGKLHRRLGKAIRLARSIQTEDIRLDLVPPDQRVGDRRRDQRQ